MDKTPELIKNWLKPTLGESIEIVKLLGDASLRRYYRIYSEGSSFIFSISSNYEEYHSFISVQTLLQNQGLNVPDIYQSSDEHLFLLQEDFSDSLYANVLTNDTVYPLYRDALQAILSIQDISLQDASDRLGPFNTGLMRQQLEEFKIYFLETHLKLTVTDTLNNSLDRFFNWMMLRIETLPYVAIHYDFHSRNIIQTPHQNPGIIDFQDAKFGPITYDLVSLLNDCYIDWPQSTILKLQEEFFSQVKSSFEDDFSFELFIKAFDITALQRHLKNIGLFCKFKYENNREEYAENLPRLYSYIQGIFQRQPELNELNNFFEAYVFPKVKEQVKILE